MTNRTTPVGTVDEELVGKRLDREVLARLDAILADAAKNEYAHTEKIWICDDRSYLTLHDIFLSRTLIEQLINRVERQREALEAYLRIYEIDALLQCDSELEEVATLASAALTGEHPPISRVDEYPDQ